MAGLPSKVQATEWPTSVYGPNPLTSLMCRHSMVTRLPSAGSRGGGTTARTASAVLSYVTTSWCMFL